MTNRLKNLTFFAFIGLMLSLSTSANAQIRAYQVSERQVQAVLDRIESRTNTFRAEIDRSLDRSTVDGTSREDSINTMIGNFETATDTLKNNFSSRRSTSSDVQEVLNRAGFVNRFMRNSRVSRSAQDQWNLIRTDLNTLAGYYRVQTDWTIVAEPVYPGTQGAYTVSDVQMRNLLDRIALRGTAFRQSFERWSRFGRRNPTSNDDVLLNITEFERAVQDLRRRTRRNADSGSVEQVLRPSASINSFISSNRTSTDVSTKWNLVRDDLNTLAGYYRMSWDWNNPGYPNTGGPGPVDQTSGFDARLTGTFRLNTAQSDNVTTVVDRTVGAATYNETQRDRVRRTLERRLRSPDTLAIEKRGQQVTMSSANGSPLVMEADGVSRTETSPNGRSVNTSVTATNRDLTINYEGDRMNDYFVSFTPVGNRQLRVTRRVYLENQNDQVTVNSVYDKISQIAEWNTTTTSDPVYTGGGTANGFLLANNTAVVATLDTPLSTRTARDGDRFSMTVTSPSQYRGAIIEGNVIGQKSGVVSGRANMSLTFDTIRLRNGQTYRFAGIVDQVRQPDGDVVTVNNEGSVRDDSQTTKTVTRAGLGAALGAIIGAIAGGGKGAAIGAGVGAGAGAGTVILQGKDNLELATGSTFTITATAPANVANNQ